MDRWKSRGGKSQRTERVSGKKIREEKQPKERRCRCRKRQHAPAAWMHKTPQLRSTFGSWAVQKVHVAAARSSCRSKDAQNTSASERFWKLSSLKSARRCGAKGVLKSKVLKTGGLRALLEDEMSQKCRPLWRETRFEVKWRSSTTFRGWDFEKAHAVVVRSTFRSQMREKLTATTTTTPTTRTRTTTTTTTTRRKFRSQTSDNMDRWKAEQGRGREKRKIRRKKSRRERVRRKKMQMREKEGKSRNTLFFQWFGAPEGRKAGSLKWRVRSQLARWEMKYCTLLWREVRFQVRMHKIHHARTTVGSWDVEKVHAVVARSTFRSQNVQNTPGADHFWQLRCRRCGAKHVSKSKC